MTLDNANMAWIAPILLCVIQIIYFYIQGLKSKKTEQDNAKWQSLQAFIERNSVLISEVDKRQDKFEVTVRGEFLPRCEFNKFLSNLDTRFEKHHEQMDEKAERYSVEMMRLVKSTMSESMLELKLELLDREGKK